MVGVNVVAEPRQFHQQRGQRGGEVDHRPLPPNRKAGGEGGDEADDLANKRTRGEVAGEPVAG